MAFAIAVERVITARRYFMQFTTSQPAQNLPIAWNKFLSHTYHDDAALRPASLR